MSAPLPPADCAYNNNQLRPRLDSPAASATRGVRGCLISKGGYAYSDNNESVTLPALRSRSWSNGDHRNGYQQNTVVAGPRIHVRAPIWSGGRVAVLHFGKATSTTPVALVPFGSFTPRDDHVLRPAVNDRFKTGWLGRPPAN